MSSAFVQIQAGLLAALSAGPALAGSLQTNRLRPIPEQQATALVLRLNQSAGNEGVIGTLDWLSQYSIECYARVTTAADPAVVVDDLLLAVFDRIATLDPASIGAQAITFTPQIDWQYEDSATPMVCAVVQMSVNHSTSTVNLLAQA